jgi:curli biogenesis system outer membrane secretion channel CsgG
MQILRPVALLSSIPFLFSCTAMMAGIANGEIEKNIDQLNEEPPALEVLVPDQLATVKKVAVIPFRDISWREEPTFEVFKGDGLMEGQMSMGYPQMGDMAAEHFENALLSTRTVDVLERSRMHLVLDESAAKISMGEALPEIAAGLAGADAVILGSITTAYMYRSNTPQVISVVVFGITLRVVDARDGRILAYASDVVGQSGIYLEFSSFVAQSTRRLAGILADEIKKARRKHPEARAPQRPEHMRSLQPRASPQPIEKGTEPQATPPNQPSDPSS